MTKCVFQNAHKILWAFFFLCSSVSADYENPEGARRDKGVTRFLTVSVRVNRGSGTICHYDPHTGLTHVLTCAHIIEKDGAVEVETFATNGKEQVLRGKVMAIDTEVDLCLVAVISKTRLEFAPIESESCDVFYPSKAPDRRKLVVCGRDGGSKPALYEAYVVPSTDDYLYSRQHLSQGGRSGGGVFNENRRIVAVNVMRAVDKSPVGTGIWVPCWKIHNFLKKHGEEWLIHNETMAKIPVLDQTGSPVRIMIPTQ